MKKVIFILIIFLAALLRFAKLDQVPPALFSDEVDVGYQAYSVLKTGRDYQGNFLPIHFQSFADFRAPVYIYAAVPTVAIFGLNEWGVRIPAAIFGLLSIVGIYFLTRALGFNSWISLLSSAFLTISPWHFHYSRAAFEATAMICFLIWGMFCFLNGLKNRPLLLVVSAILLSLAVYSYNTDVLFVPLISVVLMILYKSKLITLPTNWKVAFVVILFIFALPFFIDTTSGRGFYRFSYINIFADPTISSQINFQRAIDDKRENDSLGQGASFLAKISHNKLLSFEEVFVKNYLSAFSTDFLFIRGDPNGRHSLGTMGLFYWAEVITILFGLVILFRKLTSADSRKILLAWILLAPIPASLTVDGSNHATRLFLLLPPLIILSSVGFYHLFKILNKTLFKRIVFAAFLIFLMVQVYYFFHQYFIHYSIEQEHSWHYGFKQAIAEVKSIEGKYDKIYFTPTTEPPLIFVLFWNKVEPSYFQKNKVEKIKFGPNEEITKLGKYYFVRTDPEKVKLDRLYEDLDEKTLVVTNRADVGPDLRNSSLTGIKVIDIIEFPSKEVAFYLLIKDPNFKLPK